MKKRAILSVFDKTGLLELAHALDGSGFELVASGGTAKALREAGLDVLDVADVTGAPEILGGRVKTLHPAIHGGILARATEADAATLTEHGIGMVEIVVCNLYPFEETVAQPDATEAEIVEQIDIGGVALLRAAAKNFERVAVVSDPADYQTIIGALTGGGMDTELRRQLAAKAFRLTRAYDAAIAAYFDSTLTVSDIGSEWPQSLTLSLHRLQALRYGENPHQSAALYGTVPEAGPLGGELLQGKALSYNNLLDLDAAWRAALSYAEPAVVIVKHLSPCGVAIGSSAAGAFPQALASDPVSAFGGVIAVNREVDEQFADAVDEASLFVEAVIAPSFSAAAQAWFGEHKKNCRLVTAPVAPAGGEVIDWRAISGGFVVQQRDEGDPPETQWHVVSQRQPTEEEIAALHFAWIAAQHVKSNAIVLAHQTETVGIGGGLPSRVDAVRLAVEKAGPRAAGSVMASDAFFPFSDGIEAAAASGVTAVVEPGGSVRDDEVVATADRLGLALVFTGTRHFRH